jgi:hypothetical protein
MVPGARFVEVAYAVAGYPLDKPAGGTVIIKSSCEEAAFNTTTVLQQVISVTLIRIPIARPKMAAPPARPD